MSDVSKSGNSHFGKFSSKVHKYTQTRYKDCVDEILHRALSYVIRPLLAHDNRATILRIP